jgi:glycine cleavage system H protein
MTSMDAKNKRYPLIPADERKCVWMTTGLISYKLCDRHFQCEFCPFDQAIKNEEGGEGDIQEAEDKRMEGSPDNDPSVRINGSVFYHPDHCWVKVDSPEEVTIGIDDLLSRLMTAVKVVILPRVGSTIGQGECYAHIIQEDCIVPVISPLSGSIQAVNPRLKEEPALLTDDPRGEGWLITIKPENLENDLKNLLFGRKALSWYKREEKAMISRIDWLLKHNPSAVGPTMQDGGVRIGRLQDVLEIITAEQRAQLLDFVIARSQHHRRSIAEPPG